MSWTTANTPTNLVLLENNGKANITWQDNTLEVTEYKVKKEGVVVANLPINSTVLYSSIKGGGISTEADPMQYEASIGTYKEWSFSIDKSTMSLNSLTFQDGLTPQVIIGKAENPTSIVTINEITLVNIQSLKSINYIPSIKTGGKTLLMLSIDNGTTWNSFNTVSGLWQNVDINNKTDVKNKANDKDTVNAITSAQLELLRGTATKIKIGYYMEVVSVNDAYGNDKITLTYIDGSSNEIKIENTYNTATGNTTSYIDSTVLLGGQVNNYSVLANNVANGDSTELIGSLLTVPYNVTGITGSVSGFNLNMVWNSVTCTGYKIYDGNNTLLQTVETNAYTLVNTSEQTGTLSISAYNASGESAKTPYVFTTIPNAPSSLIVSQIPTGVSLVWNDNSALEVGYKIQKRVDRGTWVDLATTTELSYQDTFTVLDNKLYEYQVASYNASGNSSYKTWGVYSVDSVVLNAVLDDVGNKINYTWDSSVGCTGYKLSLTDKLTNITTVQDILTTSYTYDFSSETYQEATIIAYITDVTYGQYSSVASNKVTAQSTPRNLVEFVDYDFDIALNQVVIRVKDKSLVEDGLRVRYSKDGGGYQYIDIASSSQGSIDAIYSASIGFADVSTTLSFSVAHYNTQGTSAYTTPKVLNRNASSKAQIGYLLGQAKLAWVDNDLSHSKFKVYYKVDNGAQQTTTVTTSTMLNIDRVYKTAITMGTSSTLVASIAVLNDDGTIGLPTNCLTTSYATYTKLTPAKNFRVYWTSSGIAKFEWIIDSDSTMGSTFSYKLNDDVYTVEDIPCGLDSYGDIYSKEIAIVNNLDKITAKVKLYDLLDDSIETDEQSLTLIKANTDALTSFAKVKIGDNYLFTWDSKDFVANYEIHYKINDVEYVVNTQDNQYLLSFNYETTNSVEIYVFANLSSLDTTYPTNTISFATTTTKSGINVKVVNATVGSGNTIATKIATYGTKLVMQDYMYSVTRNVASKGFAFATSFISYAIKTALPYTQSTITHTSLGNKIYSTVVNRVLKNIMNINTNFTNSDTKGRFGLTSLTYSKDIKTKCQDIFVVKNNVSSPIRMDAVVSSKDVTMLKTNLSAITYLQVYSDPFPMASTYWSRYSISAFVNTEIHKIRICCLGDSITAGHPGYWNESKTGRETSQYEYWLQKRLQGDYEVLNEGYGSDTTLKMLNRFNKDILQNMPQYCIFLGGVNDLSWAKIESLDNQDYLDNKVELAKGNIINMIDQCFDHGIIPIWGTLIPWNSATGIYQQALLDFNQWIRDYCNSREGLYCVDFYNAGKDNMPPTPLEDPAGVCKINPLYDGDSTFDSYGNLIRRGYGVHPNDLGYKIMADSIPLTIFSSMSSGIKMYLDESCTVEENSDGSNIYNSQYNIKFSNLDRGRTKVITRVVKNVGNVPIMFSLYNNSVSGAEVLYSLDNVEFTSSIQHKLDNESIGKIYIMVTVPREGEAPVVTTTLATRSIKIL